MIIIHCTTKNGFRRGGILHPNGSASYPEDYFSKEDLEAIESEPKLMVHTGLKPAGPATMSEAELFKALDAVKADYSKNDPRQLLVDKLQKATAVKAKTDK